MRNAELDLMRNIESRINRIEKSAHNTEKGVCRIAESNEKMLAAMTKAATPRQRIANAISVGASVAGIFSLVDILRKFFIGG